MSNSHFSHVMIVGIGLVLFFGQGVVSLGFADSGTQVDRCAETEDTITSGEPERAAALVEAMWSNPDQANCQLARHGMDRDDLNDILRRIRSRSDLELRFENARRQLRQQAGNSLR